MNVSSQRPPLGTDIHFTLFFTFFSLKKTKKTTLKLSHQPSTSLFSWMSKGPWPLLYPEIAGFLLLHLGESFPVLLQTFLSTVSQQRISRLLNQLSCAP